MKNLIRNIKKIFEKNPPDSEDSVSALRDQHMMLIKCARRCAYDLMHCSSDLSLYDEKWSNIYRDRARHWDSIFSPDGVKNYRLELHMKIIDLERSNAKMSDMLKELGVYNPHDERMPF